MSKNLKKTEGIIKASKDKKIETIQKVLEALILMEKESIPINFLSVYKFTGVSRSWLYKEPTIKSQIENAKERINNQLMRDQAIRLKAKEKEIEILTKQNKILRNQIDELSKQLEVSYANIYKQG
ncbi:TPA: transposase [Legionella pneumophila]|nr:transposase [Legionella pneumophila]HAT3884935.1 transposase [Legionella pneumophila]HAT8335937.1 transposase [Legionella pneumophila]HAT8336245.1 transposase [Legionella pneumophila]HAU0970181.1 transposase [Legionella pneumophila]